MAPPQKALRADIMESRSLMSYVASLLLSILQPTLPNLHCTVLLSELSWSWKRWTHQVASRQKVGQGGRRYVALLAFTTSRVPDPAFLSQHPSNRILPTTIELETQSTPPMTQAEADQDDHMMARACQPAVGYVGHVPVATTFATWKHTEPMICVLLGLMRCI